MSDRSADLERLADLLVGFGANVQPRQLVGVTSYLGMEDLTRAVARSAYRHGAKYVDVFWWDLWVKHARLELADADTLDYVPPWIGERLRQLGEERAARISLTGTSAAVFAGLDPARTGRDLLPYVAEVPQVVNDRTTNWTAGPCPNRLWAARVDGHVSATMPLEMYGSYVSGIRIEFAQGQAVKVDADEGADGLRAAVARDDGASRLGEIALVDREGRIGPLGTVFYETLLDENAASHIALGNAYTFPLEDEADQAKANRSGIHVDFMIGSNELDVDGITRDGDRVPVLRGGAWQI